MTCRAVAAQGGTVLAGDWSVTVDEDGRAAELVGPDGSVQPAPMPHIFGAWPSKVLFYHGDQFTLWTPSAIRPLPEGIVSPLDRPGVAGATISLKTRLRSSERCPPDRLDHANAPSMAYLERH